jgi:hypothetical protein
MPRSLTAALAGSLLAGPLLAGCVVAPDATPYVDLGADFATTYVWRGVTQLDHAALLGDATVALPAKDEGTVALAMEGALNLDGSNEAGVLGQGTGGKFVRDAVSLSYARGLGSADVSAGLVHHGVLFGTPTPKQALYLPDILRTSTSEVYGSVSWDVWNLYPTLEAYYDIDETHGLYARARVTHSLGVAHDISIDLEASLGISSDNNSAAYYGVNRWGLSDLQLGMNMHRRIAQNMLLRFTLAGSTFVDSNLDRQLDLAGVDTNTLWIVLGVVWSY